MVEDIIKHDRKKAHSKKRKHKSLDVSQAESEEPSVIDTEINNASSLESSVSHVKKKKKDKKSNDDFDLGVVDTSILQQAGVNLGLPMADTEASISEAPIVKEKKKKKKKDKKTEQCDPPTPGEKNKNEKTLDYLRLWHSSRKDWKFNKMFQVHLLHIMYDKSLLNNEDFEILLLYLEGLKGKSRDQTKEDAEKIINSENKDNDSSDSGKEERARQIIQILS